MSPPARGRSDDLQRVLEQDLAHAVFLTQVEAGGGWSTLFPELEQSFPTPYPIFADDEETVLAYGYPVLVTSGMQQLRTELDHHVELETEYRVAVAGGESPEKGRVMAQRERYLRTLTAMLENAMVNDYGRGIVEVLVLLHIGDLARALGRVPALAVRCDRQVAQQHSDALRFLVGQVFADLFQRAAQQAVDALRRTAHAAPPGVISPLLTIACRDLLPLCEHRVALELTQLGGFVRVHLREDADALVGARNRALKRLGDLAATRPELVGALRVALWDEVDPLAPNSLLHSRTWEALRRLGILDALGLQPAQGEVFLSLGRLLKRFELISALSRRVIGVEQQGADLVLGGRRPPVTIATSTRPFDFTHAGVVDSSVRRFGLVYDLTNFTGLLEEVRKEGQRAEEKALQFMYVFQRRLEELRARHRLTFEKFLGDGAFYSSRRALAVLAAACSIQRLYEEVRGAGFPFSHGIRVAMNLGSYRLLPLVTSEAVGPRFEFFGHGVVELARLTTGKSTREVEEISEFLVNWGYDPARVEAFLRPLANARSGGEEGPQRPYAAWLDQHGELVNEGMVLTLPFLEGLEEELGSPELWITEADGLSWIIYAIPGQDLPLYVGLRLLGVARLKGLAPLEVVEATTWPGRPEGPGTTLDEPLLTILRRLTTGGARLFAAQPAVEAVPAALVAVSYLCANGVRTWVFGHYNGDDDLLHHALELSLRTPDLQRGEPLELWLFRNRSELAGLYQSLRRESAGQTIPVESLRRREGYLGCFLAAPHKAPR